MANKKKIEERNKALQARQSERTIQIIGISVIVIIVVALGIMFVSNRQTAPKQYDSYPPMTIDESRKYFATVKMAGGGEFVVQLFADKAPITVNSFVFLARDGYYDGTTFHRVLEGFMAQGGDPTGTGTGDPGYSFEDEITDRTFDKAGLLAMTNSGPNTNGSQFFITYAATSWLDGLHTIFGEVIEGMDVVNAITRREPGSNIPGDVIEAITITEE